MYKTMYRDVFVHDVSYVWMATRLALWPEQVPGGERAAAVLVREPRAVVPRREGASRSSGSLDGCGRQIDGDTVIPRCHVDCDGLTIDSNPSAEAHLGTCWYVVCVVTIVTSASKLSLPVSYSEMEHPNRWEGMHRSIGLGGQHLVSK